MDMDIVPEDQCSVCAGREDRRRQHFSTDYVRIPVKGVCAACVAAFWEAISEPPPPPSQH
jgi:hypothetical protein